MCASKHAFLKSTFLFWCNVQFESMKRECCLCVLPPSSDTPNAADSVTPIKLALPDGNEIEIEAKHRMFPLDQFLEVQFCAARFRLYITDGRTSRTISRNYTCWSRLTSFVAKKKFADADYMATFINRSVGFQSPNLLRAH